MFDKLDTWTYTKTSNCWDYVRAFLIQKTQLTADDLPKYGICPSDKKGMTKAMMGIVGAFKKCEPEDHAIACHFVGKILWHVGVVESGRVRHASDQWGVTSHSLKDFEKLRKRTEYYKHKKLCPR